MPLNLPPSMKRTLVHAGGGAAAGAALGGLTADPEHRVRGAVQGGAIGGLAAGGASALANRSAGQRINSLKGDVAAGAQQLAGEQAAHAATQSELGGRLYTAETRIGRLLGQPTNRVSATPTVPPPPGMFTNTPSAQRPAAPSPAPAVSAPVPVQRNAITPPNPADPSYANTVVDSTLQRAMMSTAPTLPVQRPVVPTAPTLPIQRPIPPTNPDLSVSGEHLKAAMSPLGGALAGAITGGAISGGASAISGERDPKKLARNAAGGAVLGGCAGFGIAHNAGKCEHARGMREGYARRKQFEPQIEELMQQAGTRVLGPLDALRGAL